MNDAESPIAETHHEIRHRFEEQLNEIHRGMIDLGTQVLANSRRAGEVLLANDLGGVDAAVAADEAVDAEYSRLERLTFEVMARQQPMARDLRFLLSATRMLYGIERSGDLGINCAKALQRAGGFTLSSDIRNTLEGLLREATGLFEKGIAAIAGMDAAAGTALDHDDDVVDELCSRLYTLIAQHSEELGLERSIELTRVGRYLERIADHAVNIAGSVSYIVTGDWLHLAVTGKSEKD
jgi:phosphate transport system protein